MPKLRLGQESAVLGPARFQDAMWKCFKCQTKRDTLSSVFISFSPVFPPPGVFTVSTLRPEAAAYPARGAAPPPGAPRGARQLHLPTIYFCSLRPDSLTFLSNKPRGPHPAFSPPSCPAVTRSQLCTWVCHTPSGQGHWSHGQNWALQSWVLLLRGHCSRMCSVSVCL